MSDLITAEECLLNAQLDARRRCVRGELTRDELAVVLRHLDAAIRTVRAVALALPSPLRAREGA